VLLRALAEWLCFLWRVDTGEANPVLLAVAVEERDCIAVRDTHHSAEVVVLQTAKASRAGRRMRTFSTVIDCVYD